MLQPHPPGPAGTRSDDAAARRSPETTRVPQYRLLLRGRRPSECFAADAVRHTLKPG